MKTTLIALAFCAFFVVFAEAESESLLPKEILDLLDNLNRICQGETGVSDETVDEIRKAKLRDDPKVKCYLKCMMRQLQAMTEDGSLDLDMIEATMPEKIKEHGGFETVKKCNHIKEDDMCETAYKLMICFQENNPELTALFE